MNKGTAVFIILVFVIAFTKTFRKTRFSFSGSSENQITEYALEKIETQLDNVNVIMKRINDLENLITDVELCDPDSHMKNISLNWADDEEGFKSHYDFFLTGNNLNSEMILKMAYAERKHLRSLLFNEIRILAERSNENCNENYPVMSRGGVRKCRK